MEEPKATPRLLMLGGATRDVGAAQTVEEMADGINEFFAENELVGCVPLPRKLLASELKKVVLKSLKDTRRGSQGFDVTVCAVPVTSDDGEERYYVLGTHACADAPLCTLLLPRGANAAPARRERAAAAHRAPCSGHRAARRAAARAAAPAVAGAARWHPGRGGAGRARAAGGRACARHGRGWAHGPRAGCCVPRRRRLPWPRG